ncbi:putative trichohyalin-like [Trypanosoma conorhini]|uniref:Putative trichohyalin-like n=1 Tax=Trypanosoma conorhini TaxID=83891 RepID=A0A422NMB4_9TRYP|nr:putative trichohyalin-like [Trypanosoma conorhini]RNF06566.1 putative trichohyalin-like [Trypanosoma conorhini]
MKPRGLWELMTDIVTRCLQDSLTNSPELILDEALESCPSLNEEEEALVREIVLGTLHFEKLSEGMVRGYRDCMRHIVTNKCSMYLVAYLMVFQYTVLGGHRVRELIHRCTTTPRLVEYLEYMLDPASLMEYSNPYWSKHYDVNFITTSVLRPLLEITPHAREDVIQWLLDKTAARVVRADGAEDAQDVKQPSARTVAPQPSRVASAPEERPDKLPPEEVRAMLYTIPEKRPPRIDYTKPPENIARHRRSPTEPIGFSFMKRQPRQNKNTEEPPVCHAEPLHASPEELRQMLAKPVAVRMTAAAIRREAQTYLKQMEEQKKSLEEMEEALHNSREFEEWQRQEETREAQQRRVQFLSRKAQIAGASNNALQKRRAVEERKHIVSSQVRADLALQLGSFAAARQQKAAKQRKQASKLRQELDENRRKAIDQAQRVRLSAAADVKAETKQLREAALEEEGRLRTQRLILIQEIRQLRERNRQRKAEMHEKNVRLQDGGSEDSAYGGLCVAALREKLLQAKEESARLEEERRTRFGAVRQGERDKLDALSAMCANWRQNTRRARADELKTKAQEAAKLKARKNEEEAQRALLVRDALKQKRKDRRTEFAVLKAEERRRNNELLLLAQGASDMEEKHWSQQELGVINRLTVAQNKEFRSGFRQPLP